MPHLGEALLPAPAAPFMLLALPAQCCIFPGPYLAPCSSQAGLLLVALQILGEQSLSLCSCAFPSDEWQGLSQGCLPAGPWHIPWQDPHFLPNSSS